MELPHFGGSRDGDGEGDDGSDEMTSNVNNFTSDHVDWHYVRTLREGSSVPYGGGSFVDKQSDDPQGVPDTTNIGPMDDQHRADDKDNTKDEMAIYDARADVETTSQLDTSVLETPSHPTPILHIFYNDNENPTALSSQQARLSMYELRIPVQPTTQRLLRSLLC